MNKEDLIQITKKVYSLTQLFPKKEPLRCKIREVADDILGAGLAKRQEFNSLSLNEGLRVIDSFFEVAQEQNWVAAAVVLEIKREYAKISADLEQEEQAPRAAKASDVEVNEKVAVTEVLSQPTDIVQTPEEKIAAIQIAHELPLIGSSAMPIQPAPMPTTLGSVDVDTEEGDEEEGSLTDSQILRQKRIVEYLKEKGQAQVWEIQKIFPATSKRTIRRDFRFLLKQGVIDRIGERNKTYYKLKVNLS